MTLAVSRVGLWTPSPGAIRSVSLRACLRLRSLKSRVRKRSCHVRSRCSFLRGLGDTLVLPADVRREAVVVHQSRRRGTHAGLLGWGLSWVFSENPGLAPFGLIESIVVTWILLTAGIIFVAATAINVVAATDVVTLGLLGASFGPLAGFVWGSWFRGIPRR